MGGLAQFGLLVAVSGNQPVAVAVFAALAGAGTGAGYSLLVSMVRDWFGDDATLPNYAIAYVGKAVGALAGIGLAGLVVTTPHTGMAFAFAGCLGLLGAALISGMHQPGIPALSGTRS
jgi:MFS family permease